VLQFFAGREGFHQLKGFRGDGETQVVIAGGKARHPQHPQGVFGKGVGDVAQYLVLQILQAAVGVNQIAFIIPGHGIDGEIPAHQILFKTDIRAGNKMKALVALAGFALGAGQGVFVASVWMNKHGKVAPHRAITQPAHFLRGGAHHHPVTFLPGKAQ